MKRLLAILLLGAAMNAQSEYKEADLAIKRIALFSSGVGFFEREGELSRASQIALGFDRSQMSDALKSLTIYDSASVAPFVSYPGEATLAQTLQSVKINLRGEPTIENILSSLKGETVEIAAGKKNVGKIIGVQSRQNAKDGAAFNESVLTLLTDGKIEQFAIKEIESYKFSDPKIGAELEKALSFLAGASDGDRRVLNLFLDGSKKRTARVSYVIAAPVWKANYRLDLGSEKPFMQGWAIVDNASDADWKNVELSLVVGRPVSFTQPYYSPYFVRRPEIPLAIAGFAEAQTYDDGFEETADSIAEYERKPTARLQKFAPRAYAAGAAPMAMMEPAPAPFANNYQTASAKAAGEQFVFTLKNKISIDRRQSAMVPLAQGEFDARKVSIFSPERGANPALGAELKNTIGMKLPAGAITVFDGGIYAGDALLEFLPQNEKRLISYGDDLSVRGTVNQNAVTTIAAVKIKKGVMTVTQKTVYEKEYIFKNSANNAKTLIVEHPFIAAAKLVEPAKAAEKTDRLYRFEVKLPSNKETKFAVKEESVYQNTNKIIGVPFSSLLYYATNTDYPKAVRDALKKAEPLAAAIEKQRARLEKAKAKLERKANDQARVRSNLMAFGADSTQGKSYANEVVKLDKEIAQLSAEIDAAENAMNKAQKAFDEYIEGLDI